MAHAAAMPTAPHAAAGEKVNRPNVQALPVTPGKVAMWLFLATEIMFFTGLIGSYIVLRAGSPAASYFTHHPPATDIRSLPPGEPRPGEFFAWPKPYDKATNPLAIDLTAFNTFLLICSSVTMVYALSGIQKGNKAQLCGFLVATVAIGACFLSIQVYEYYQLMFGHNFPIGISANSHFRPSTSLFGSCFFTMTGFHGSHVLGGVILLTCITIQSFRGTYTAAHHSAVELAGLYWHFVDLVWILLFTVVYLI